MMDFPLRRLPRISSRGTLDENTWQVDGTWAKMTYPQIDTDTKLFPLSAYIYERAMKSGRLGQTGYFERQRQFTIQYEKL